MNKTIFSILLNRKNKVLINENDLHSDTEQSVVTDKDKCIVATMNKNLEPLGYTMSEGLFNLFMKMESDQRNPKEKFNVIYTSRYADKGRI